MALRIAVCLALLPALGGAQDDPPPDPPTVREQVSAHMKVLRSRRASPDERQDAMEGLLGLGLDGALPLLGRLERDLISGRKERRKLEVKLARRFQQVAERLGQARVARQHQAELTRLRKIVLEGPVTKPAIHGEKDPAVARLKELLLVRVDQVWAAEEELYLNFSTALDLMDEELFVYDYWLGARELVGSGESGPRLLARSEALSDPAPEAPALLALFDQHARYALAMTEADRKVMRANAENFVGLDPKEAAGIVDLNDLRVLLGLNALRLDLKLSRACRGHSRDMVDHSFFSHDSPVEGKETPWKRAALEGTSAGAENIAWGSNDGPDAIRAWWYSPGHHVNMMGGHRRVGLGRHESHWTQCFGG